MRRKTVLWANAFSLLLFTATGLLALSSYDSAREILWFRTGRSTWLGIANGTFEWKREILEPAVRDTSMRVMGKTLPLGTYYFHCAASQVNTLPFPKTHFWSGLPAPRVHQWARVGLETYNAIEPTGTRQSSLALRFWVLLIPTGVGPLMLALRYLYRKSQIQPGCCKFCGYDLRASTGRCPECGAPIASAAASHLN